jgi:arylsulfatase A-like enzyme
MMLKQYAMMALGMLMIATAASAGYAAEMDRTVLPIQLPKRPLYTEVDARNATPPPRVEPVAPEGAPNVVIILIDDLGFGATETFGGPVATPALDRLAESGLRYNNFHTTALCSPTRAALKSGRNHHTANMGFITEMATGFPGATGEIPNTVAPLATILQLNGYSTGAFGKWHETAAWETSVSGPYTRWPTGPNGGFDKFYGFLGGESNQWAPYIHDGTTIVELPDDPDYHFLADMTDQAINWAKFQQAMTPDRPFFVYFAPGATHAPHHVPKEWIKKWEGKFDKGWDEIRAETLARQIKLGIVPEGTKLAPKPKAIKDWGKLSADEQKLFSHQASVFAAFLEYTDHEIGRFVRGIEEMGELDNTLIFFVAGDNGTSGEGGQNGMFNEYTYFNGVHEKVEDMLKHLDEWGGPETYPHMAAGWSVAFDAPFGWMKQVPSDFGGTRNGMVVHWPKGIKAKNELRTQFSHVIDVAPTVLEAIGIPEPKIVNSTPQVPMEGTSLVYSFDDGSAKERHTTQYFEIAGNRAIYDNGWYARKIHRAPWEPKGRGSLTDDSGWQLYNVKEDFSLANDLTAQYPEKLKELQDLFLVEAEKYHVLPMDDRVFERLNAAAVGRPDIMAGRTSLTLAEGMTGIMESTFINVKNQSKTLTAEIEVPEGEAANGIIIVQGGRFGGWALYVKDGVPTYAYNFLGLERTTIAGTEKLATGKSIVRFEFNYDGGGPGKGGMGTLFVNDKKVAEGRIEHTQPGIFSADETADVGIDLGTPVVEAIGSEAKSRFTGGIPKVTVEIHPQKPAEKAAGDAAVKEAHKKIQEVPEPVPVMPTSIEAASFAVYDPGVAGSALVNTIEVSARVTAIDKQKRQATLEGPAGNTFTVKVGPEAVNFDQVSAGDRVNATLTRELVAFVADAGTTTGDGAAAVAAHAKKGEQPGGLVAETVQLTGTIVNMDHWKRLVALQFEDGSTETFPVRPDVLMEDYEVGEKVIFQATETIAVDVTKR